MSVKAKKHLGQHFLNDENIALKIVDSFTKHKENSNLLEIGPGMGVLTKYLFEDKDLNLTVVDIDLESVGYLKTNYPEHDKNILYGDFLNTDLNTYYDDKFAIIGNFPYNISSQIMFKVFDYRDQITEVVGMFQKEVAERIAASPKKKTYGILSVLIQAFYDTEYLFTVDENVFTPPPKVKSGVIRLKRNDVEKLDCDEKLFFRVVKQGFNHRRKTLRNSLKPMFPNLEDIPVLKKRAEELSVQDFIDLTNYIKSVS